MKEKLKVGNEIKITTKDGKSYEGIFMAVKSGYLSTVVSLGIILTFPINSIINVIKI